MAITALIRRSLLASTCVLAPERYDPRRAVDAGSVAAAPLGDLVSSVRELIQPGEDGAPWLVLDTSDAREGIVVSRKTPSEEIGSAKKRLRAGDVIVSRLRPYLRQVAYVDDDIPECGRATLACSTEFFVLRGRDARSIAFLAPFLLSQPVQHALAAAQEGGHHPRFDERTLLTLPVPESLIAQRQSVSESMRASVREYRSSESRVRSLICQAEKALVRE